MQACARCCTHLRGRVEVRDRDAAKHGALPLLHRERVLNPRAIGQLRVRCERDGNVLALACRLNGIGRGRRRYG